MIILVYILNPWYKLVTTYLYFIYQLGNGDHNFNSKQFRSAFVSSSNFFMEIFFYFPFRNVFSLHVNTSANYS